MLDRRYEGLHCTLDVRRPAARVVVIAMEGTGGGELGDRPFRALAHDLQALAGTFDVFIDTRATTGPSLEAASRWAAWLARHKHRFAQISILARSRYVQLTADVLRRFAAFGELMRVYTNAADFDDAIAEAIESAADAKRSPSGPPHAAPARAHHSTETR